MDYTVCSRETERDYTWDNAHASSSLASFARDTLAPAFEGSLTTSRFAALLRCPSAPNGVILGVSVSTKRIDFRHRPIRTMAFLRAENPDEEKLFVSFFAECLRKQDGETLDNLASGVAKAVESLYQTKKPDEFLAFCKSLKPVDGTGGASKNRRAIPRNDGGERKSLADALPVAIAGDSPFLFALTDRLPTDVLASLGSMFDRGTIRIFSKATSRKERIPEPPQKYGRAATVGGLVLLFAILGAAIGTCSQPRGPGKRNPPRPPVESKKENPTSIHERAGVGELGATNAQTSVRSDDTNSVPTEGRRIEPVRKTRQGGVSSNAAPASSETPAAVTNNPAESLIGGGGESDASTNHLERASGGKVLVTNAQASVGLDATNAIPTEERIVDPAPDIHQDGVSTNSAPAATETPTSLTNEADSSFIGGGGKSDASTNLLSRAIDGGVVATNAPASGGIGATDAIPAEGRVIESAGKTRQDCVSSNAVPAEVETATTMTNQYLRLNQ